ncbi:unnamed protein product [Caenorhabditis bovis]|uniref:Actin-related protein 6 n=1 Tax=Caenorhabditis bovis TaxID=2654633 RepID=A0A8S1EXI4_9PELO|nr:unnamed protein product [Caenorhabditis bovis]
MVVEESIVILDNGGYHLKLGTSLQEEPRLIPNSIVKAKYERKRVFIAHEQDECLDKCSLFYVRPIERGYVTNWETQQQIWEKAFQTLEIEEPNESRIMLTDNNYLVPALPDVSSEILFETFGFHSVFKGAAASFVGEHSSKVNFEKCALIVDCGFSSTHVAPYVDGILIQEGVIRIDISGKALTNKLKDWISYRQLNVIEETHIINECKEDVCYVSLDFNGDLKRKSNAKRYVMPDFHTTFRGIVKDMNEPFDANIPSISLGVERFATPELLFNPSDVDLDQMGVGEAVVESLARCPENLRAALSENIVVIGGSAKFAGFQQRLESEVRSLLPVEFDVNVHSDVGDPQIYAWKCARELVAAKNFKIPWVDRKEWNEKGENIEFERFFKTIETSDDMKAKIEAECAAKPSEEMEI